MIKKSVVLLISILLVGCDKEDIITHSDDHVCADITVVTPPRD